MRVTYVRRSFHLFQKMQLLSKGSKEHALVRFTRQQVHNYSLSVFLSPRITGLFSYDNSGHRRQASPEAMTLRAYRHISV